VGGSLDPDTTHQYVEIRGRPFMPLADHYLVFIEAEQTSAGAIENVFDLGAYSLGSNGYLTIRQKQDPNPNQYRNYTVHPKATNLSNEGSGVGFGSGAGSTVGASNMNAEGLETGSIEAGGWTAMLIRTDGMEENKPVVNFDLDENNDGLDVPLSPEGAGAHAGWTILDSIGLFAEEDEGVFGRVYSPLAYGFDPSTIVFGIEPGAQYVQIDWPELEAEYIGRWGNSTGSTPGDWHVSNVTDRIVAGFTNMGDFRQSADPHAVSLSLPLPDGAVVESTHDAPYRANLTSTIGGPNYPLNLLTPIPGDFDGDGDVDESDLVDQWTPRFEHGDLDGQDFLAWQQHLGMTSPPPATQGAVPEPGPLTMIAFAAVAMGLRVRCRR
jgi:hypothetical protein